MITTKPNPLAAKTTPQTWTHTASCWTRNSLALCCSRSHCRCPYLKRWLWSLHHSYTIKVLDLAPSPSRQNPVRLGQHLGFLKSETFITREGFWWPKRRRKVWFLSCSKWRIIDVGRISRHCFIHSQTCSCVRTSSRHGSPRCWETQFGTRGNVHKWACRHSKGTKTADHLLPVTDESSWVNNDWDWMRMRFKSLQVVKWYDNLN